MLGMVKRWMRSPYNAMLRLASGTRGLRCSKTFGWRFAILCEIELREKSKNRGSHASPLNFKVVTRGPESLRVFGTPASRQTRTTNVIRASRQASRLRGSIIRAEPGDAQLGESML
jgi:hypothetical protein